MNQKCQWCGKIFDASVSYAKFCSKQCGNAASKDRLRFSGLRDAVLHRDHNKCTTCGGTKRLVVHHKDGNTTNNTLDNLATLCSGCHAVHHKTQQDKETRECKVCGRTFLAWVSHQVVCPDKKCKAAWKAWNKRSHHESIECVICGNIFTQKHSSHETCSKACGLELSRIKKAEYYQAHRDETIKRQHEYYQNNKEKVKAYVREWNRKRRMLTEPKPFLRGRRGG